MIIEYPCPYCEKCALSPRGVRKHVKKYHPEKLEVFDLTFLPVQKS
jgi:hypothetical protein